MALTLCSSVVLAYAYCNMQKKAAVLASCVYANSQLLVLQSEVCVESRAPKLQFLAWDNMQMGVGSLLL